MSNQWKYTSGPQQHFMISKPGSSRLNAEKSHREKKEEVSVLILVWKSIV